MPIELQAAKGACRKAKTYRTGITCEVTCSAMGCCVRLMVLSRATMAIAPPTPPANRRTNQIAGISTQGKIARATPLSSSPIPIDR